MFTSYSRKQAGVIFSNIKRGNLTADEQTISHLYFYADATGSNWASHEIDMVDAIRKAVDSVFSNDLETAQKQLDRFEMIWNLHYIAA